MANSARGQDEASPVFWLATWAGKIGLSLGIACIDPAQEN